MKTILKRQTHSSEVQRIVKAITKLGGVCYVMAQGQRTRNPRGVPDIYVQWPTNGRRHWVEVKVGRDRFSDAQIVFVAHEHNSGGDVLFGDYDAVIQALGLKGVT